MNRTHRTLPLALVLAIVGAVLVTPAQADLSGFYNVRATCDQSGVDARGDEPEDVRMMQTYEYAGRVRQEGERLNIWLPERGKRPEFAAVYLGRVRAPVSIPGAVAAGFASWCGGGYERREIMHVKDAFVRDDGTLTFRADSTFITNDYPTRRGVRVTGTCTYRFVRRDTRVPTFPECFLRDEP